MKRIFPFLIALNVIALGLLVVIYYFGFDLQWGLNRAAVTWGLPVLAAGLVTLTVTVVALRKMSCKWAFAGLAPAIAVLIYYGIMIYSFSYVLLPHQEPTTQNQVSALDNEILANALSISFHSGKYVVVDPFTKIPEINRLAFNEHLSKYDYYFNPLLDSLLAKNQSPVQLSLQSSPREGYFIDYSGTFTRYINKSGDGGWLRWNLFHPQVEGYARISLPAYDPQSGYVLIYTFFIRNSKYFGGGETLFVYHYENGKLTPIDTIILSAG